MTKDQRMLLKFIKIARENMPNTLYLQFNAFNILPIEKDWAWHYECEKCEWIIRYIEWHKDVPFKHIKKDFEQYINKLCYYKAFIAKAKELIKEYKKQKSTKKFLNQLDEYNKQIEAKDAALTELKRPIIRVLEWLASILNRLKNKKTTKK